MTFMSPSNNYPTTIQSQIIAVLCLP